MAAGLTLKRASFSIVEKFLQQTLKASSGTCRAVPELDIDAALIASGANDDLLTLIERAGPFGQGNPQPRFAFPSHSVKFAKVVGDAHVRAVLEAAAVGIPDREYGQEILACVVLKPGSACSDAELRDHCLKALGRYKTPKEFRFLAELPKMWADGKYSTSTRRLTSETNATARIMALAPTWAPVFPSHRAGRGRGWETAP